MSATIDTINKYTKPSTGGDYPSILDTNTEAWYMMSNATIEEDDSVQWWSDESGNNLTLNTTDEFSHRAYWETEGVRMGPDSSLEVDKEQTQPFTIYLVAIMNDWTVNEMVMFFGAAGNVFIKQDGWEENPAGYGLSMFAGSYVTKYGISLGVPHLFTFVFNGASSSMTWDEVAATTGNAGSNTPTRFEFGYGGTTADFTVKELIIRSGADSAQNRTDIQDYLNTKYSIY